MRPRPFPLPTVPQGQTCASVGSRITPGWVARRNHSTDRPTDRPIHPSAHARARVQPHQYAPARDPPPKGTVPENTTGLPMSDTLCVSHEVSKRPPTAFNHLLAAVGDLPRSRETAGQRWRLGDRPDAPSPRVPETLALMSRVWAGMARRLNAGQQPSTNHQTEYRLSDMGTPVVFSGTVPVGSGSRAGANWRGCTRARARVCGPLGVRRRLRTGDGSIGPSVGRVISAQYFGALPLHVPHFRRNKQNPSPTMQTPVPRAGQERAGLSIQTQIRRKK